MLPTLKPGQDVLVWCWFNKYKVGDIVVIRHNGREMVKRISKFLDREEMIYVVGDNKQSFLLPDGRSENESTDSRSFGPVRKDQIIGKVIVILR